MLITRKRKSRKSYRNTKSINFELLLQQRQQIQKLISSQNSFLWKIVITLLSGNIAITILYKLLDSKIITSTWLTSEATMTVLSFLIVQIMFVLLFVVMGFLFGSNNNRLYICAIDEYLYEEYGIFSLFQDGEVTKSTVTGIKEIFPQSMIALGLSVIITFIYMLIGTSMLMFLLKNHFAFLICIAVEVIFAVYLIVRNQIAKIKKMKNIQTNIEIFCLNFFYR